MSGTTGRFDWSDYLVFCLSLSVSIAIGIYFGCFGDKQKSINDYLLGGKSMTSLPVALSVLASMVTGITLISIPAEVYTDGATYWITTFTMFFACIIAYKLFIPVLYELKVKTSFEYLEYRYDKSVRMIASTFYFLTCLLFFPAVIYLPALTLSQATGVNIFIISSVTTMICVFYTMIGGFKAVVWTDFAQMLIMFFSCLTLVIIGTIKVGGIGYVFKTTYDDGVLNIFNMDPNPFQRTTFWTILFGRSAMQAVVIGTTEPYIQRYLSLPSMKDVRIVKIIFSVTYFFVISICIYSGLILYAAYYNCDPVEQKLINKPDQIFPYFILDKIGDIPILPGLFIAGIFSAGLSTLSTGLNTVASIVYGDYLQYRKISEFRAKLILKFIIIALGLFCIIMGLVVDKMGKILSSTVIMTSLTVAPISSLFILGMLVPQTNKWGAVAGVVSSFSTLLWLGIGATMSNVNSGNVRIYPNDTCSVNRMEIYIKPSDEDVFILYKLSYINFINVGIIVALIFGIATSYATGKTDISTLDPKLISPPIRRFLPKQPQDIPLNEVKQ